MGNEIVRERYGGGGRKRGEWVGIGMAEKGWEIEGRGRGLDEMNGMGMGKAVDGDKKDKCCDGRKGGIG